jgi:NADPH-dependent 2,4-dienoyl-CoA reductase/sulfur reductase-like enzyme
LLDPPAVDALRAYRVRVADGRVLVGDQVEPDRPRRADGRRFVIVGAGAAGAIAAQTLREIGFGGEIVMLDRENRVPYDRTILSKYVLSGATAGEKSPLQTQAFYEEQGIDRRAAEVVRIDPAARRVFCADGSTVAFDAVLLASGGAPVVPGLTGADLGNVFTLRSQADAQAILAQAERSRRAVVLGASFIGMEVAASLRERRLDVVVVGQETAPFARQLGEAVGRAFVGLHKRQGVTFRLGRQVAEFVGGSAVQEVVLDDGDRLPADLVVVGFGVQPVTDFAKDLPLADDGGIVLDQFLSAAPGVFAAGDIARFPLRGDGPPIRVEHWRVAEQQGRLAARNMAGEAVPYDAVPVFWTIQYMKRLDYIGHAKDWDETVIHGDLEKPEFLVYYVKNGRVIAAAGLDRDRDTAALIELFTLRPDWTAAELGESPAEVLARTTV